MENTVKQIQAIIESLETKREELEKQGKDNYADEIKYTFRPSAKLFLAAWESLLDDIDLDDDESYDDENFEIKSTNPNTYGS